MTGMTDTPNIINMNDLKWEEAHHSEHYSGWCDLHLIDVVNRGIAQ
jgi:hypothetical protein